jgi:hypothetical protein
MNKNDQILFLSDKFYKLAAAEKVPPRAKSTKDFLKVLEKLETFQARIDCAEKNLKHISSGSSRIVYDLGKNRALKLASNEKGLFQNKAETEVKDKSKYINKCTSHAKNYSWVIAPLAKKLTEREFFDLTDVSFKDFGECIKYIMRELSTKERKEPENFQDLKDMDIIKEISEIGLKHKMMPGDIARISSWKVRNNIPVLVDLGLNTRIYKDYYKKKESSS